MTTLCIVQARYDSSRLPGKVAEPILGVPILVGILRRLQRATLLDEIVVATTTSSSDDLVVALAGAAGVEVARGSVFDVLDRFHQVVQARPEVDVVVRVTGDCPFVDPGIVDLVISRLSETAADFAANRLPPPFQRTYPVGLDVEVCTRAAIDQAWAQAERAHQREHVMPFLYEEPGRFAVEIVDLEDDLSAYRWTVDTPDDLEAVRQLAALAGPEPFDWTRVLEVAGAHPELAAINSFQRQKLVSETDSRWRLGDSGH